MFTSYPGAMGNQSRQEWKCHGQPRNGSLLHRIDSGIGQKKAHRKGCGQ